MRSLIPSIRIASCFLFLVQILMAQTPTVGVITASTGMAPGYSLVVPVSATSTFLVDNCGREINRWENSTYMPGTAAYLLEDGSLLRTCRLANPNFIIGGQGGRVERWSWNDSLIWSYNFSDTEYTQHHDIEPLPNGNILLLAVESKSGLDPVAAGRNPTLIANNRVWSDFVVEIEPIGADSAAIVWEWHAWDHLVQDFSSTASNYGVVADHPELIDLNYVPGMVAEDWLHTNSVAYSAELDQIAISVANLDEIWLVDHSTTTAESASHSGGQRGKGGDLLYRWGNPRVYQRGGVAQQKLFFQHNVHWVPNGLPNAGKLLIFNNGASRNWSSVELITPPQSAPGDYQISAGQAYGPLIADRTFATDSMFDFFTRIMGGVQEQPNGNWLIAHAAGGYAIEVDTSGDLVWQYKNPVNSFGTTAQGDHPTPGSNSFFRLERYAPDFPGFVGKDLSPGAPLETGSDLSNCLSILIGTPSAAAPQHLQIYPNPVLSTLHLDYAGPEKVSYRIVDLQGRIAARGSFRGSEKLDVTGWPAGIYFVQTGNGTPKKLIKLGD